MGIRFRKSINLGGARINMSKSGVGFSVGVPGFRYTKKAGGGTRTTVSVPGTGVSYVKDSGSKTKTIPGATGCLAILLWPFKVFFKLCWYLICAPFWLAYMMCYWTTKFFVELVKLVVKKIKEHKMEVKN